jgi:hypothetical protein
MFGCRSDRRFPMLVREFPHQNLRIDSSKRLPAKTIIVEGTEF